MITSPKEFAHVAREWAIKYAGAPADEMGSAGSGSGGSGGITEESLKAQEKQRQQKEEAAKSAQYVRTLRDISSASLTARRYRGYNRALVDRFSAMGFDVPTVVAAMEYVGIDTNEGQDYELEEEYMGDITARLFHES